MKDYLCDIIIQLDEFPSKRRTLKGLTRSIGIDSRIILKTLTAHPELFEEVNGCKGRMWQFHHTR